MYIPRGVYIAIILYTKLMDELTLSQSIIIIQPIYIYFLNQNAKKLDRSEMFLFFIKVPHNFLVILYS